MDKLETPPGWRRGQTIFNFLEWLSKEKGYNTKQSSRMADPFHIPNNELDELYAEYLSLAKWINK